MAICPLASTFDYCVDDAMDWFETISTRPEYSLSLQFHSSKADANRCPATLRPCASPIRCTPARNQFDRSCSKTDLGTNCQEEDEDNVCEDEQLLDFCQVLPSELCILIFSHLGIRELGRAGQVSKLWMTISNDCYLWKQQYKKHSAWLASNCNVNEKTNDESSGCPMKRRRGCPRWRDHFNNKVRAVVSQNWRHGYCALTSLEGHRGRITALKIETDHHRYQLASSSWDCTIKLWSLPSAPSRPMKSSMMEGACSDEKQTLPFASSGGCVRTLRGHRSGVLCMEWKDDFLASGSDDGDIRFWCLNEGRRCRAEDRDDGPNDHSVAPSDDCIRVLPNAHKGGVWTLHFAGNMLVSGGMDEAKVWDMRLERDQNDVDHMDEGSNGYQGDDGTHGPVETLPDSRGFRCMQISQNRVAAAGGSDGTVVKLYDLASCQLITKLSGHHGNIHCLQLSGSDTSNASLNGNADGEDDSIINSTPFLLATGAADCLVKLWDIRIGMYGCIRTLAGHAGSVTALSFAGNRLVSGASYDTCAPIRVWNIGSGRCVVKIPPPVLPAGAGERAANDGMSTATALPPVGPQLPPVMRIGIGINLVSPAAMAADRQALKRSWGSGGTAGLLQRRGLAVRPCHAAPTGLSVEAVQFSMTRLCTAHDRTIHVRSFCT